MSLSRALKEPYSLQYEGGKKNRAPHGCCARALTCRRRSVLAAAAAVVPPAREWCQYLYFCTGQASKLARCLQLLLKLRRPRVSQAALVCQYLYFFTSKASKLSTCSRRLAHAAACSSFNAFNSWQAHERQYLYFCTSKAIKLLAQARACCRMLEPHGVQLLA